MGRSKEDFIEKTGGFRTDDFDPVFRGRQIEALEDKLRSGKVPLDQVDDLLSQIRKLKGLPSEEWDYEPSED